MKVAFRIGDATFFLRVAIFPEPHIGMGLFSESELAANKAYKLFQLKQNSPKVRAKLAAKGLLQRNAKGHFQKGGE